MILFTADWHIKLGQKNIPKEWSMQRYKSFFGQLYKLELNCDKHIIGGDIFDRLPTLEELELFFSYIKNVKIQTLIYDGNHEATKKNHTFFSYLKEVVSVINPLVKIIDKSVKFNNFGILPYVELHKKDSIEYFNDIDILFTHVRGEIPPHVKPEVDLDRFNKFKIVFAGDLHAHNNTQRNIVYPGSPMTTTFHRKEVDTGFLLIDDSSWEWSWNKFDLPQLIRKTVQDPKDMVPTDYHHTIYELEGNIQELAEVKNSELLDKKVVKRSSEASLLLTKDMSIEQELVEYLTYILELNDSTVQNIIGIYRDHVKSAKME